MSVRPAFTTAAAERALDAGDGVVRLAPTWVPRVFSTPGRRIRLHPDDYYAFGKDRGGIDERWLASPITADNGPATGEFEGLSLVRGPEGELIPFDQFIAHHGAALIGSRIWSQYAKWPVFAKFFDNEQALPFHVHHRDEVALEPLRPIRQGQVAAKPEGASVGEQTAQILAQIDALPVTDAAQLIHDRQAQATAARIAAAAATRARAAEPTPRRSPTPVHQPGPDRSFGPSL